MVQKKTSLIYTVGKDQRLYQSYLGARLDGKEEAAEARTVHPAYATFGTDNLFELAIRVTHNDGNPSLELKDTDRSVQNISSDVTLTRITLKDPVYPVEVILNFRAFYNENVIEQWAEIRHQEKEPVTLYNYASSMLHFDAAHYWLTQFSTATGPEEMRMQESELTSGIKIIDSKLGTRAHMYQSPNFLLSLDKQSDENHGEVIAGSIGWSGNFQLSLNWMRKTHSALFQALIRFPRSTALHRIKLLKHLPSFLLIQTREEGKQAVISTAGPSIMESSMAINPV